MARCRGEALRQDRGQPAERLVDVERQAEAPGRFKRDEAVQGGANDSRRVDRVVVLANGVVDVLYVVLDPRVRSQNRNR